MPRGYRINVSTTFPSRIKCVVVPVLNMVENSVGEMMCLPETFGVWSSAAESSGCTQDTHLAAVLRLLQKGGNHRNRLSTPRNPQKLPNLPTLRKAKQATPSILGGRALRALPPGFPSPSRSSVVLNHQPPQFHPVEREIAFMHGWPFPFFFLIPQ